MNCCCCSSMSCLFSSLALRKDSSKNFFSFFSSSSFSAFFSSRRASYVFFCSSYSFSRSMLSCILCLSSFSCWSSSISPFGSWLELADWRSCQEPSAPFCWSCWLYTSSAWSCFWMTSWNSWSYALCSAICTYCFLMIIRAFWYFCDCSRNFGLKVSSAKNGYPVIASCGCVRRCYCWLAVGLPADLERLGRELA